jgi:hypothetical protein
MGHGEPVTEAAAEVDELQQAGGCPGLEVADYRADAAASARTTRGGFMQSGDVHKF